MFSFLVNIVIVLILHLYFSTSSGLFHPFLLRLLMTDGNRNVIFDLNVRCRFPHNMEIRLLISPSTFYINSELAISFVSLVNNERAKPIY